jgi:type VI secretion system secreted protein Hcp
MAMDMFIKIGDLKGESRDKTHKEEIDVLAWSWGMSNSGSAHTGGGAGAGKANVQDVSLTKYIDKSSPDLMLACLYGQSTPAGGPRVSSDGGVAGRPFGLVRHDLLLQIGPSVPGCRACYVLRP